MFEVIFVVLTVGLMVFAWWWLKRRRAELLETFGGEDDAEAPPQQLTRDALLNRPRQFDPTGWDDNPSTTAATTPPRPAASRPGLAAPDDEPDAAPVYFDREFLQQRQRLRDAAGDDAPPAP
ncbi:MAG: hypothetical protein QM804_05035 [Propionicimonas sp.]